MLKQLARLTNEADGRFASDEELTFLDDYLDSVSLRIQAYENVRDSEEAILDRVEAEKRAMKEDWFHMNGRDITDICHRDMTMMLRSAADAMLLSDLDRLRDGLLLWDQTIVRAFGYSAYANLNYKLLQNAVKAFLPPEEAALILPAIQLEHTILSA
jgi:hypothetical protein